MSSSIETSHAPDAPTVHSVPTLLAQAYIRLNSNIETVKNKCLTLVADRVLLRMLNYSTEVKYNIPIVTLDMLECLNGAADSFLAEQGRFYRVEIDPAPADGQDLHVVKFRHHHDYTSSIFPSSGARTTFSDRAEYNAVRELGNAIADPAYLLELAKHCVAQFSGVEGLSVTLEARNPTRIVFDFRGALAQATRQGEPK